MEAGQHGVELVAEPAAQVDGALQPEVVIAASKTAGSICRGQWAWMSVAGYFGRSTRVTGVTSAGVGS
jgi:hypothetical protein